VNVLWIYPIDRGVELRPIDLVVETLLLVHDAACLFDPLQGLGLMSQVGLDSPELTVLIEDDAHHQNEKNQGEGAAVTFGIGTLIRRIVGRQDDHSRCVTLTIPTPRDCGEWIMDA
jgi:hypothetical protein